MNQHGEFYYCAPNDRKNGHFIRQEEQGTVYAFIGWKLHLAVPPDLQDKPTSAVHQFLEANKVDHKVGSGGSAIDEKGMTIYVGSFDKAQSIAEQLSKKFSLPVISATSDVGKEELLIRPQVGMRFVCQGLSLWHQYGREGISELSAFKIKNEHGGINSKRAGTQLSVAMGLGPCSALVNGDKSGIYKDFSIYVSHRLLKEKLGAYYIGAHKESTANPWYTAIENRVIAVHGNERADELYGKALKILENSAQYYTFDGGSINASIYPANIGRLEDFASYVNPKPHLSHTRTGVIPGAGIIPVCRPS